MYQLLSTSAVREVEDLAEADGLSKATLMDVAGHRVAELTEQMTSTGPIVVFCGKGNNGGDGWVAARYLLEDVGKVCVISSCDPTELSGIARDAALRALDAGVPWRLLPSDEEIEDLLTDATAIIDGMFGAGFHGVLGEPYRTWIELIENHDVRVIAIDIPTGLSGDLGEVGGCALHVDATLSTIAVKLGMIGGAGREYCGRIVCDDLGIEERLPGKIAAAASAISWPADHYHSLLPLPAANEHKYSRGNVGIIAGSVSYAGAAVLASGAAARSGAGYVRLAVPEPIVSVMQAHLASVPVAGFPADESGAFSQNAVESLVERIASCDALVCGPGLSVGYGTRLLVRTVVEKATVPLLLDADALSIVAGLDGLLRERGDRGCVTVLTPHEGEMSRILVGLGEPALSKPALPMQRVEAACLVARRTGAIVVLKGPATVITDGEMTVLSGFGTPALATAGTGDVLSGIIGALLAQGLGALDAATLGVYLHSCAGVIAAYEHSEMCVIAEDVIEALGDAVMETMTLEER